MPCAALALVAGEDGHALAALHLLALVAVDAGDVVAAAAVGRCCRTGGRDVDGVVARPTEGAVATERGVDRVVAAAGRQVVGARTAVEVVVARAAVHPVVAQPAGDVVSAGATLDAVVA